MSRPKEGSTSEFFLILFMVIFIGLSALLMLGIYLDPAFFFGIFGVTDYSFVLANWKLWFVLISFCTINLIMIIVFLIWANTPD